MLEVLHWWHIHTAYVCRGEMEADHIGMLLVSTQTMPSNISGSKRRLMDRQPCLRISSPSILHIRKGWSACHNPKLCRRRWNYIENLLPIKAPSHKLPAHVFLFRKHWEIYATSYRQDWNKLLEGDRQIKTHIMICPRSDLEHAPRMTRAVKDIYMH
jgi:hypothetical protein